MSAPVIRRPARVALVAAPPPAPVRVVAKLTPAEERERLVRDRLRRIHGEVIAEFKAVGARVDLGDPMRSARAHATGGDS